MLAKTDRLDRRLLYHLDLNARASYTKLAGVLRVPQETVRYRVNSLCERKIINKFFTVINPGRLGFYIYKMLFKLHNVSDLDIEDFIGDLCRHKAVTWVVRTYGIYDVGITLGMSDAMEISDFIDKIAAKYNRIINSKTFSINIQGQYLTRNYLLGRPKSKIKAGIYSAGGESYPLDSVNNEILKALTGDARISAADISGNLGVSTDTVINRIRKMEKDGIINRYNLVLNHNELGQFHYKVLLYLNQMSEKLKQGLLNYCEALPNIVYIIKVLGPWDYELDVEVESINSFQNVMMLITKEFPRAVSHYEALMVNRIYKYDLYPET